MSIFHRTDATLFVLGSDTREIGQIASLHGQVHRPNGTLV